MAPDGMLFPHTRMVYLEGYVGETQEINNNPNWPCTSKKYRGSEINQTQKVFYPFYGACANNNNTNLWKGSPNHGHRTKKPSKIERKVRTPKGRVIGRRKLKALFSKN